MYHHQIIKISQTSQIWKTHMICHIWHQNVIHVPYLHEFCAYTPTTLSVKSIIIGGRCQRHSVLGAISRINVVLYIYTFYEMLFVSSSVSEEDCLCCIYILFYEIMCFWCKNNITKFVCDFNPKIFYVCFWCKIISFSCVDLSVHTQISLESLTNFEEVLKSPLSGGM